MSIFYDDIYGRAPWVNGLDNLTVVPGNTSGIWVGVGIQQPKRSYE